MTDTTTQDRPRAPMVVGVLAAFVTVAFMLIGTSRAALSGVTDNTSNSIGIDTVWGINLFDDDTGVAMFSVTDMEPTDSATACIAVTYDDTPDPGVVRLYSGGFTDSDDVASYLNITVEEGSLGTSASCASFVSSGFIVTSQTLATWDGTYTSYATGAGTWNPPSGAETASYRITIELDAAAPTTIQGDSISDLAFVWETQA